MNSGAAPDREQAAFRERSLASGRLVPCRGLFCKRADWTQTKGPPEGGPIETENEERPNLEEYASTRTAPRVRVWLSNG